MPPLRWEGIETVPQHRLTEDHTVSELLGGDDTTCGRLVVVTRKLTRLGIAAEVWVTLGTEPVEGTTHI